MWVFPYFNIHLYVAFSWLMTFLFPNVICWASNVIQMAERAGELRKDHFIYVMNVFSNAGSSRCVILQSANANVFDSFFKPKSLRKKYLRLVPADRKDTLCIHSDFLNSKIVYWTAFSWQALWWALGQALFQVHWIFLKSHLSWKCQGYYFLMFTFDLDCELWKWSCMYLAWCLADKLYHLNPRTMKSWFLLPSFLLSPSNFLVGCEWDWYANHLP